MKGFFALAGLAVLSAQPAFASDAYLSCVSTDVSEARLGIRLLVDAVVASDVELSSVTIRIRTDGDHEPYGEINRPVQADPGLHTRVGSYRDYRRFIVAIESDEVYLYLPRNVSQRTRQALTAFLSFKSPDDVRFKRASLDCTLN